MVARAVKTRPRQEQMMNWCRRIALALSLAAVLIGPSLPAPAPARAAQDSAQLHLFVDRLQINGDGQFQLDTTVLHRSLDCPDTDCPDSFVVLQRATTTVGAVIQIDTRAPETSWLAVKDSDRVRVVFAVWELASGQSLGTLSEEYAADSGWGVGGHVLDNGAFRVSYEIRSQPSAPSAVLARPLVLATPPDLVLESVSTRPSPPVFGQPAEVCVRVKNAGVRAAEPFVIFLLEGAVPLGAPALLLAALSGNNFTTLGAHEVAGLAGGQTIERCTTITMPASGPYVVTAGAMPKVIQLGGDLAESDDSNNVRIETLAGIGDQPDLVIASVTGLQPPACVVDRDYRLQVTIRNQGGAPSDSFKVRLYEDGDDKDNEKVDELAAGAETTVSFKLEVDDAGKKAIEIRADADDRVTELKEDNNAWRATLDCKAL